MSTATHYIRRSGPLPPFVKMDHMRIIRRYSRAPISLAPEPIAVLLFDAITGVGKG